MPDLTPDEMVEALKGYRDRGFATMILAMVQLVAQEYPEELRNALALVFDLQGAKDDARMARTYAANALDAARDAHESLRGLRKAIEKADVDTERINRAMDDVSARQAKLKDIIGRAVNAARGAKSPVTSGGK